MRNIVLIAAVAILGLGLIMIVGQMLAPQAPARQMQVAIAAQQIEPYNIITQDMVRASDWVYVADAEDELGYPVDSVVGLMTTDLIPPGAWITGANAREVKDVRFAEDLGLEVVTFQAGIDRTVGGKLRAGHIVNLYGYGQDKEGEPFTVLIEPQLWVVAVSAAGQPVSNATPLPDPDTGEVRILGGTDERSASLVTVAVRPDQALNIIDSVGAQGLEPWITLAANQTAARALATPVPAASPTFGLPPDIALTATALAAQIRATPVPVGPRAGDGGTR